MTGAEVQEPERRPVSRALVIPGPRPNGQAGDLGAVSWGAMRCASPAAMMDRKIMCCQISLGKAPHGDSLTVWASCARISVLC